MRRPFTAVRLTLTLLLLLAAQPGSGAEVRLAVLDFELNDLTPLPGGADEQARTASVRPLLEKAIAETSPSVRIVAIDPQAARNADAGFGYLFEHGEVAAQLGAEHGADWILVGRLTKPSFLFAYLMARQHYNVGDFHSTIQWLEKAEELGLEKTTPSIWLAARMLLGRAAFYAEELRTAKRVFQKLEQDQSLRRGARAIAADWRERCEFFEH